MLLYQVRVDIDQEREEAWYSWMVDAHIPEVLASGCFSGANIGKIDGNSRPGFRAYLIQYECDSRETFDRYNKKAAPALQRDHAERFGGAFHANRTVVEVLRTY